VRRAAFQRHVVASGGPQRRGPAIRGLGADLLGLWDETWKKKRLGARDGTGTSVDGPAKSNKPPILHG